MNDDTALREQLLEAQMQREIGEITDEEFARDRARPARRASARSRSAAKADPARSPSARANRSRSTEDSRFQIEASISGDFHEPSEAPHTTIVEERPPRRGIIGTESGQTERVLDVERVHAETLEESALPLPRAPRTKRAPERPEATRTSRTSRTTSRTTSRRTKIR